MQAMMDRTASSVLLLIFILGNTLAWDGCGDGRWRCGNLCIDGDAECNCGGKIFNHEAQMWCCQEQALTSTRYPTQTFFLPEPDSDFFSSEFQVSR